MKLYASAFSAFVILLLAVVFGVRLGLYDTIPHLDKIFHFMGGAAIAAIALSWFEKDIQHMPRGIAILFTLGITAIVGIGWEYGEALSGAYTKDFAPLLYKYFSGNGLVDTLWDTVLDMLGALALTTTWLRNHRRN